MFPTQKSSVKFCVGTQTFTEHKFFLSFTTLSKFQEDWTQRCRELALSILKKNVVCEKKYCEKKNNDFDLSCCCGTKGFAPAG